MRRSKGQSFMPDFMASIVVFSLVITIFLSSWSTIVSHQEESEVESRMMRAEHTSTFLVTTPGYPDGWNQNNVEIAGFAKDENILNYSKIQEFGQIDYKNQTRLMRAENFYLEFKTEGDLGDSGSIGSPTVAYVTWRNADFNRVRIPQSLNRSDVEWDIYWPSSNDEDKLDSLNVRNVYNYSDSSEEMMEDVIENASQGEYSSIVSESSNVYPGDISNEDELRQWVEDGGTFFHSEEYPVLVEEVFSLQKSSDVSSEGLIVTQSPLLNSSYEEGDSIVFDDDQMAFEDADEVFVEDAESPNGCLACRWDVGDGRVYYIQDTFSDRGDYSTTFETGDAAFSGNLFYGQDFSDPDFVYPVKRTVKINDSGDLYGAEMNYVIYR